MNEVLLRRRLKAARDAADKTELDAEHNNLPRKASLAAGKAIMARVVLQWLEEEGE